MSGYKSKTTTGFLEAIANKLEGMGLSLTKGTNLFAEVFVDNPDEIEDQLVIYDDGYESQPGFVSRMLWDVRFATSRKNRVDAQEALRAYVDAMVNSVRFTATSDSSEKFNILRVVTLDPPDVVEKLSSGRFLVEATIQLDVLPV